MPRKEPTEMRAYEGYGIQLSRIVPYKPSRSIRYSTSWLPYLDWAYFRRLESPDADLHPLRSSHLSYACLTKVMQIQLVCFNKAVH